MVFLQKKKRIAMFLLTERWIRNNPSNLLSKEARFFSRKTVQDKLL